MGENPEADCGAGSEPNESMGVGRYCWGGKEVVGGVVLSEREEVVVLVWLEGVWYPSHSRRDFRQFKQVGLPSSHCPS